MKALPFGRHDRRVGIGSAHAVISHAPITAVPLFAIGTPCFSNPVMVLAIGRNQFFSLGIGQRSWEQKRRLFPRGKFFSRLGTLVLTWSIKQLCQMGFHRKTRL